jgi:hypothetical protein
MTNMEWIAAGNTGCTFATLFSRKPESVGWQHMSMEQYEKVLHDHKLATYLLVSIEFPSDWNNKMVREWAKKYKHFFEVDVDSECIGLRIGAGKITTWVQYFGPDSHVVTRQTPNPMLMYTRKLNPLGYVKQVGFSGVLHLAHAFGKHLTQKMSDVLWHRSYEQVRKKIGHAPTIKEAAKTTWLKKDVL